MPTPIDFIVECIKTSVDEKSYRKQPSLKWPCSVCNRNVNYNNPSIQCTSCTLWTHIKCTDMTLDEYNDIIDRNNLNSDLIESESWSWSKCTLIHNAELFPFGLQSDSDIININSSNSMKKVEMNLKLHLPLLK